MNTNKQISMLQRELDDLIRHEQHLLARAELTTNRFEHDHAEAQAMLVNVLITTLKHRMATS